MLRLESKASFPLVAGQRRILNKKERISNSQCLMEEDRNISSINRIKV